MTRVLFLFSRLATADRLDVRSSAFISIFFFFLFVRRSWFFLPPTPPGSFLFRSRAVVSLFAVRVPSVKVIRKSLKRSYILTVTTTATACSIVYFCFRRTSSRAATVVRLFPPLPRRPSPLAVTRRFFLPLVRARVETPYEFTSRCVQGTWTRPAIVRPIVRHTACRTVVRKRIKEVL